MVKGERAANGKGQQIQLFMRPEFVNTVNRNEVEKRSPKLCELVNKVPKALLEDTGRVPSESKTSEALTNATKQTFSTLKHNMYPSSEHKSF